MLVSVKGRGRLAELLGWLQAYASSFDPDVLSLAQARQVMSEAATTAKVAADLRAKAAARIADLSAPGTGRREAARELARASGEGLRRAEEAIETQRKLGALPEVAAAARRGELSPTQVRTVADAASADPSAAAHLLEVARSRSVAELGDEAARVKAAADADPEARRRRLIAGRALRTWRDGEGFWNLHLRHTPETGAVVRSAMAPFVDQVRAEAGAAGRHERLEALEADAVVRMAEASVGADPAGAEANGADTTGAGANGADTTGAGANGRRRRPPVASKVIVRIDLTALLRGRAVSGEVCEIAGVGPVAVSAVCDLMDSGDPFLAAVVTDGERLAGAVHLGRRARALQETALDWLYPECAVAGCTARAHLETDHRIDWAQSHITVLDLLDRLCGRHHGLKTRKGWALVDGTGTRAFVPPDDPRHPRHAGHPPPPPPRTRRPGPDPDASPAA